MSPEHFFEFGKADRQADIYSLGKILFEAVEGKLTSKTQPFKGVNLNNPENPFFKKLDQIIQDATAEDQENRLESVAEFRQALLEVVGTAEKKAPRKSAFDAAAPARPFSAFAHSKWIWTGIALAVISITLVAFWLGHYSGESEKSTPQLKTPQTSSQERTFPPSLGSG